MQIARFLRQIPCCQIHRTTTASIVASTPPSAARPFSVCAIACGCRRCGVPPEPIPFLQDTSETRKPPRNYWQSNDRSQQQRDARKSKRQTPVRRVPNNDHIMRIATDAIHRPPRNGRRVVSRFPDEKPQPISTGTILRDILRQVPLHERGRYMSTTSRSAVVRDPGSGGGGGPAVHPSSAGHNIVADPAIEAEKPRVRGGEQRDFKGPSISRGAILREILRQVPLYERGRYMSTASGSSAVTRGPGSGHCDDPAAVVADADDSASAEEKPRFRGELKYCRGPSMVVHHASDDGVSDRPDGGPKLCFEPTTTDTFACCARRRGI